MKITIKNPWRLIAIACGVLAYYVFGSVDLGVAFFLGTLVGSFKME